MTSELAQRCSRSELRALLEASGGRAMLTSATIFPLLEALDGLEDVLADVYEYGAPARHIVVGAALDTVKELAPR